MKALPELDPRDRFEPCECEGAAACVRCEGHGAIECSRCDGTGECACCHESCRPCGGDGERDCEDCDGTGRTSCCPKCGGCLNEDVWQTVLTLTTSAFLSVAMQKTVAKKVAAGPHNARAAIEYRKGTGALVVYGLTAKAKLPDMVWHPDRSDQTLATGVWMYCCPEKEWWASALNRFNTIKATKFPR